MVSSESLASFSIPQLPQIAWVIALCFRDNTPHMLLAKRLSSPVEKRTLPGGRIEKGESPIAAAQRELLEETGLSVSLEKLAAGKQASQRLWVDGQEFIAYGFLVILRDDSFGGLPSREVEKLGDWQWVCMRDVVSLILHGLLPRVVIESDWFKKLYIQESHILPPRHRFPFHEL